MKQFAAILFFFLAAASVHAHGIGQTITRAVGDYVIDVDYDAPALMAGESVRFDFYLRSVETGQFVLFDEVGVNVRPRGAVGTTLSAVLPYPDVGASGVTFIFPRAGAYELSVRYYRGNASVAEAVFPLEVTGTGGGTSGFSWLVGLIPGILLGFAAAWMMQKK